MSPVVDGFELIVRLEVRLQAIPTLTTLATTVILIIVLMMMMMMMMVVMVVIAMMIITVFTCMNAYTVFIMAD